MRLPNFLIVGVPKSATTSLHNYLAEHPQIYMPEKKDLNFFVRKFQAENVAGPGDKLNYSPNSDGLDEYEELFEDAGDAVAIGESSTSYFYFSECSHDIKAALGSDLKIIVVLRDPVERAFSNYMHLVRVGRETLPFREALQQEEKRRQEKWSDFWRYKDHSLYAERLGRCLGDYGVQRVKIVLYEELSANNLEVLRDVFRFLRVDTDFVPPNLNIIYNKGGRYSSTLLSDTLAGRNRVNGVLKRLLPRTVLRPLKALRSRIMQWNTVKEGMDPESRAYLKDFFRRDMEMLETEFGLDLQKWKTP